MGTGDAMYVSASAFQQERLEARRARMQIRLEALQALHMEVGLTEMTDKEDTPVSELNRHLDAAYALLEVLAGKR